MSRLTQLQEMFKIQEMNRNYSQHYYSMYVGMAVALAVMENRNIQIFEPPEVWDEDKEYGVQ